MKERGKKMVKRKNKNDQANENKEGRHERTNKEIEKKYRKIYEYKRKEGQILKHQNK